MIDRNDWNRALCEIGVKPMTATRWAPAFESECQPERFSRGMDDLLDFVPQILHECQMLERTEENLKYSADRIREVGRAQALTSRWRSLVSRADSLANNPPKLAEAAYGGRMGNGPEGCGDGWNYRGRCPIMATGLDAYLLLGKMMGQDLVSMPHLIEGPIYGLAAAVSWWEGRVPDSMLGDLVQLRRRVNGGELGLAHCQQLASLTRQVFA